MPVSKVWREEPTGISYLWFWCEGCDTHHRVPVTGDRRWEWNCDDNKPTLHPSIHVAFGRGDNGPKHVCHSFVRDGAIHYLLDSTHALRGRTVNLTDIDLNIPDTN